MLTPSLIVDVDASRVERTRTLAILSRLRYLSVRNQFSGPILRGCPSKPDSLELSSKELCDIVRKDLKGSV